MVQNKGMKKERKAVNMITDSPGSALLLFALPMILGNLFQQFYNIMDSVVVGRFVSEEALASVGASYSITNVFIAIAIGGGIGSSVVVSQFLREAAGEYEDGDLHDTDQLPDAERTSRHAGISV